MVPGGGGDTQLEGGSHVSRPTQATTAADPEDGAAGKARPLRGDSSRSGDAAEICEPAAVPRPRSSAQHARADRLLGVNLAVQGGPGGSRSCDGCAPADDGLGL